MFNLVPYHYMLMHISYYTIAEVFGLSEVLLLLVKRSKKDSIKSRSDKNSLLLLWIVITASMTMGGLAVYTEIGTFERTNLVMDIGLALAIIGFIIRWIAIIQLGKMFTVDVAIDNKHQLRTTGLYKTVRHPSYLGLMLIICGIAVCMANTVALAVVLIPIFLALNYRINVEERALSEAFGYDYEQYKKTTARLIPGVY
jgi:protein-S-isoprenylcysteine O-methyltransferase Ste14